MNRVLKSAFLVLLLVGASAAMAEDYRIAFVNATKVFEESPQYQAARKRLQKEFSRREKDLLSSQSQLKQLEEKLKRDGTVMSESEVKRLERDILSRRRKLKNAQTEFREDLNLRQNEEFKKLRTQVREVIRDVGKAENIDLIVSDGVVYFSKRIDISEMVLEKLRELVSK
ncbi:OmpH/Skp family outer membrane protein [endosymbiont of Ridgeia piscesae]|uniref:Periplasmic chaperone for outer membrane proteins Skp n=2 Tax=sulfur-oxidizing symbionts TaxID=32036 RepID=A0A0T5Z222_9GAMM|nr:OmpH family outer membrane protein [endosymbiont of Ridgeia piscesae]KRT54452.1 periplasmic chaperone for outer membrane proteins Skp [endosymbiont of Ridgeia piscesae]KRT56905.1 periplasmic chaperone for outer membrane proteins Skp [endosymbiont of Ridgeia piscesae]